MMRVREVASWFLSRENMTHKKLQKLCYYAQAWHCALFDEPLFQEDIQAWVHGPVIVSLYREYSKYKWDLIPSEKVPAVSEDAEMVLEAVYNTYGGFTGDQLENLTHSEDPWIEARKGLEPWESSNNVISITSMKDYYGRKYEEAQND